ncbi:hypothetical protein [Falsibacillus pallidus]|uniref:Uncharacterized protein n=1 Tax=Falsibacillus pallidus TaxID=493781 RepID=A0A370GEN3_9BACI|nr:hypothetical protein [Falsibacillus pallidus]RDI41666.1 hypothetical protein DFR59_107121 [Falsibacillus pallidus]
MKKLLIVLVSIIFFGLQIAAPSPTNAATTYSAFEASKIVFQEHFITGNHLQDSRLKAPHSGANEMRLAEDAAFLSVYTYQAKQKGDSTYTSALSELNKSIAYLYSKVSTNESQFKNAFQAPGTGLILQASIMMKKFNMSDLSAARQDQVNYLYNNTKSWLNSAYNSTASNGYTFRYNVEHQITTGSGENIKAPFAVNILAIYAGALALDSDFLFKNYGVNSPTDYPYRNDIANIGNYLKAVGFGDYSTEGRLTNVGGGRDGVGTGYATWVGLGLSQIAHGTVYTQYFSQRPSSTFMTEAEAVTKGMQTVYANRSNSLIPSGFYGFAQSSLTDATDVRAELYALAWTGDQGAVNWIDSINGLVYTNSSEGPVICRVAASDVNDGDTSETNFHRAVSGLTAGMLNGVSFNN